MNQSWKASLKNKKLALVVAGAMGFGLAFGMTPSQAMAATTTIESASNNQYTVNGSTMNYKSMVDAVKAAAAVDNSEIVVKGSNAATALTKENLTLGANTVLKVTGATNDATITNGTKASTVSVDGTSISGTDVNLKSVDVKATGKKADISLSGNVGTLKVTDGVLTTSGTGTLNVDTLTATGTDLEVNSGTIAAKSTTLGSGTVLSTAKDATLSTDTLTLESGSTVSAGTTVTTDTVVVKDTSATTNLTVTSKSGGTVTVDTSSLSADAQKTVKVATTEGTTTTVATVPTKVAIGYNDGAYYEANASTGEKFKTGIAKADLLKTINDAYANGATTVSLSKNTAYALSGSELTVPAGKTIYLHDNGNENYVSATAKTDATVSVDGTTVKAAKGAAAPQFTSITVSTPSATVVNAIEGVTADKVTVKSGTVKTTDVTAKELTIAEGAAVVGTNEDTPAIKADKVTVASADQLLGLTVAPATEGQAVTYVKANGSDFTPDEVTTLKSVAAAGTELKVNGVTEKAEPVAVVTGNAKDGFVVNGVKTTADGLAAAIAQAYETKDTVQLNEDAARALSGQSIAVPAGKTLSLVDNNSDTVSALASDDKAASVSFDGATLKTATNVKKIVVNSPNKVITNGVTGLSVDEISVTSGTVKTGDFTAKKLTLTGNSSIVGINDATPIISADTVDVSDVSKLSGVVLKGASGDTVTVTKNGGALTAEEFATVRKSVDPSAKVTATVDGKTVTESGLNGVKTPAADAEKEELAAIEKAAADPFANALPSASEIDTKVAAWAADAKAAGEDFDTAKAKQELRNAVVQAAKPLAAASLTGARSGMVLSELATQSVTDRTSDLRDGAPASAVANKAGEESVWFSVKHSDMDVDDSNDYGKSKVKLTAYTLGYDMQTSPEDFFGVYIGSTTGHADFNARVSGQIDVKDAVHGGVYGTHLLGNGQYLDYQLGGSTFDNKYRGKKWSTNTHGVMFGYGLKTKSSDQLTVNPYIRFKYDHINVADATFAGNTVTSDSSNAWSAKLGVNFQYTNGLYGGLAYSRGLSGSYDSYVNGIAMPTSDFNANVFYLNLGYRGWISPTTEFNVNAEKTFCDYDGWSALGRFDFHF